MFCLTSNNKCNFDRKWGRCESHGLHYVSVQKWLENNGCPEVETAGKIHPKTHNCATCISQVSSKILSLVPSLFGINKVKLVETLAWPLNCCVATGSKTTTRVEYKGPLCYWVIKSQGVETSGTRRQWIKPHMTLLSGSWVLLLLKKENNNTVSWIPIGLC